MADIALSYICRRSESVSGQDLPQRIINSLSDTRSPSGPVSKKLVSVIHNMPRLGLTVCK